ncbi:hypothetical protein U9M48_036677 [Paspalum notatum var. saurae]|uniref:Reverse transcriptase domain-containing protein n=1 Tax=Paspalum notatum var. saurae TaxID=547442 RepID=A0AAQ3X9S1_PASNO
MGLLDSFADSVGLKINFSKTSLTPINIPQDTIAHLTCAFGCSTGSLPFTYLGLPLGSTKPKVEDFLPLVQKCERRLASTVNKLTNTENIICEVCLPRDSAGLGVLNLKTQNEALFVTSRIFENMKI